MNSFLEHTKIQDLNTPIVINYYYRASDAFTLATAVW